MSPQSDQSHKSVYGVQFRQPKVKEAAKTSRQTGEPCAIPLGFVSVKTSFLQTTLLWYLSAIQAWKTA